jgi:hypothetical protein
LRDQIGIRKAASTGGVSSNIDEMRTRLAEMAKKLIEPKANETPNEQLLVPTPDSVPTQTLPASSTLPQSGMQTQTKKKDESRPEPTYHPISNQPINSANAPQASIMPVLQILATPVNHELIQFTSRIACTLSGQMINVGDALVAKMNADRYDIGRPNEQFAFANVSKEDFKTLRDGPLNMPEPVIVKGNGHLSDPH